MSLAPVIFFILSIPVAFVSTPLAVCCWFLGIPIAAIAERWKPEGGDELLARYASTISCPIRPGSPEPMSENGSIDRATSMGAVRLTVSDLEGVRDFYGAAIGLTELAGEGDVVRLGADSQSIVELVGEADAPPRP